MKTKPIVLVLALSLLLTLCSCGVSKAGSTPAPSSSEDQPSSYLFTDDMGREVELPTEITRIVPSSLLSQIILYAIAPDLLVGVASDRYGAAEGILSAEYLALPCFGSLSASSDLNVEELALAAPQLIIDIGEPKDSIAAEMDALQAQTLIPSVYISATLETMPDTFRKLGKLLNRQEKGEQLARFCERVYSRTCSIMEQVGGNKVDCLYVLGEEGLNVIAANSYHAELLDLLTNNLAVVDNPLSKGSGNAVTMEQIALWNPDFIIFAPDSIYSTAKETESWSRINAIINGNYVEVPDAPHNWMSMPPSVQRYLGLIWLPAVLYPDYCDYDVKADIMEYFELFYNCTLTDDQYESLTANAFLR